MFFMKDANSGGGVSTGAGLVDRAVNQGALVAGEALWGVGAGRGLQEPSGPQPPLASKGFFIACRGLQGPPGGASRKS